MKQGNRSNRFFSKKKISPLKFEKIYSKNKKSFVNIYVHNPDHLNMRYLKEIAIDKLFPSRKKTY